MPDSVALVQREKAGIALVLWSCFGVRGGVLSAYLKTRPVVGGRLYMGVGVLAAENLESFWSLF